MNWKVENMKNQKIENDKEYGRRMKKLNEKYEKSLEKLKVHYDASTTILQVNLFNKSKFGDYMVKQNVELNDLLLLMKKRVLEQEKLNTKLKMENNTLCHSIEDFETKVVYCHY